MLEQVSEIFRKEYGTQGQKKSYADFKCQCGTVFTAEAIKVKSGHTQSCGCTNRNRLRNWATSRGYARSGTRLLRIWKAMRNRCYNKNASDYEYYGAAGVTICDEWRELPDEFYKWADANGYSDELTIDRIDVKKGYTPENCRWADVNTQRQNTRLLRRDNTSGYRGVGKVASGRFKSSIMANGKAKWLGTFDTAEEAAAVYDAYVIANGLQHALNVSGLTN